MIGLSLSFPGLFGLGIRGWEHRFFLKGRIEEFHFDLIHLLTCVSLRLKLMLIGIKILHTHPGNPPTPPSRSVDQMVQDLSFVFSASGSFPPPTSKPLGRPPRRIPKPPKPPNVASPPAGPKSSKRPRASDDDSPLVGPSSAVESAVSSCSLAIVPRFISFAGILGALGGVR